MAETVELIIEGCSMAVSMVVGLSPFFFNLDANSCQVPSIIGNSLSLQGKGSSVVKKGCSNASLAVGRFEGSSDNN